MKLKILLITTLLVAIHSAYAQSVSSADKGGIRIIE